MPTELEASLFKQLKSLVYAYRTDLGEGGIIAYQSEKLIEEVEAEFKAQETVADDVLNAAKDYRKPISQDAAYALLEALEIIASDKIDERNGDELREIASIAIAKAESRPFLGLITMPKSVKIHVYTKHIGLVDENDCTLLSIHGESEDPRTLAIADLVCKAVNSSLGVKS